MVAGRMGGSGDYRGRGGLACPGVGAGKGNLEGHRSAWGDSREGSYEVAGWVGKVGSLSGALVRPV